MSARLILGMAGLLTTLPVAARELKPEEARGFVAGKLFAYNCLMDQPVLARFPLMAQWPVPSGFREKTQ